MNGCNQRPAAADGVSSPALKPSGLAHLHPHLQSQLHCAAQSKVWPTQVLQPVRAWHSSPSVTALGLAHLCLGHQGHLHCIYCPWEVQGPLSECYSQPGSRDLFPTHDLSPRYCIWWWWEDVENITAIPMTSHTRQTVGPSSPVLSICGSTPPPRPSLLRCPGRCKQQVRGKASSYGLRVFSLIYGA